tara:strand:+ start:1655 stop:2917 length:1263 start_codon:yes stop_codon:yes gene_type:complete
MNNLHIILLIVILVLLVFIYKREKFLNYSICDTVPDSDSEKCISYGCEMKEIKAEDIKCLDPNNPSKIGENNSCKVRRETNIEKLKHILESVYISRENLEIENFTPRYSNNVIILVKPGDNLRNYLKEDDLNKQLIFSETSKDMLNGMTLKAWNQTTQNKDIVYYDEIKNQNLVKILIIYYVDNTTIDIRIMNVNISRIKLSNNRYLDQINSFDYCYKLGGNEVNYVKGRVRCDNPIDYSKCEKVNSKGLGAGCFHNKSKESCLFNTTDDVNENNCKWISSYSLPENTNINYYKGYCVDKKYKIDYDDINNECLFKNKNMCRSSPMCVMNENTGKCLNKKHMLCEDIDTKEKCNNDIDCLWDNNLQECNIKKNLANLIKYDKSDILSYNIIDDYDTEFLDDYISLASAFEKEKLNKNLKF